MFYIILFASNIFIFVVGLTLGYALSQLEKVKTELVRMKLKPVMGGNVVKFKRKDDE